MVVKIFYCDRISDRKATTVSHMEHQLQGLAILVVLLDVGFAGNTIQEKRHVFDGYLRS